MRAVAAATAILICCVGAAGAEDGLRPYTVVGDAIPDSLTGAPGDRRRKAIVTSRQTGLCLLISGRCRRSSGTIG